VNGTARGPLYGALVSLAAVGLGVVAWLVGGIASIVLDVIAAVCFVLGLWFTLVTGQRLLIERGAEKRIDE
jgi:hypothetical protein